MKRRGLLAVLTVRTTCLLPMSTASAHHAPYFGPVRHWDPTVYFTPSVPIGAWRGRIGGGMSQ